MRSRSVVGAIVVGLAALGAWACSSDVSGPPPEAVLLPATEVDTLARMQYSGAGERVRVIFTDQETFAAYWDLVHSNLHPSPAAPTLDFETSMVIAAAMGSRATGGYTIAIEAVHRSGDDLYVSVTETSPGRNCMLTQAFTAPVMMVRVPRVKRAVHFLEETRVRDCE